MITVNLELSKKLKEAGYPQKGSYFTWEIGIDKKKTPFLYENKGHNDADDPRYFASPTADEILDFLPAQIKNKRLQIDKMPAGEFCISYIPFNASDQEEIVVFGTTPTLADTLAKMWLYLKENNLLEVKG